MLCVDDANVRELLGRLSKPVTTYGFSEDAQIRAVNVRHEGGRIVISPVRRHGNDARCRIRAQDLRCLLRNRRASSMPLSWRPTSIIGAAFDPTLPLLQPPARSRPP